MFNPNRTPRPRLTLAILGFALVDIVGMVVLALGLAHLTRGPGVFVAGFPSSSLQAVTLTLVGAGLMFWAGAQILGQIARQQGAPEAGE